MIGLILITCIIIFCGFTLFKVIKFYNKTKKMVQNIFNITNNNIKDKVNSFKNFFTNNYKKIKSTSKKLFKIYE